VRKGFFFGFLAGSAIASALFRARKLEAPTLEEAKVRASNTAGETGETLREAGGEAMQRADEAVARLKEGLERLRQRVREAISAGQDAAAETEEDMRRRYEEMSHQKQ
jgi:gas vesicle protein